MANNYTETSSFLAIPPEKLTKAKEICVRVEEEIANDESEDAIGYCDCHWEIIRNGSEDGVWFHSDESFSPEHVEKIARALIEELDLEGEFICSYCYLCSKPRVDEFGGGAFILAKGMPTHWVDAQTSCLQHYKSFKESQGPKQ